MVSVTVTMAPATVEVTPTVAELGQALIAAFRFAATEVASVGSIRNVPVVLLQVLVVPMPGLALKVKVVPPTKDAVQEANAAPV